MHGKIAIEIGLVLMLSGAAMAQAGASSADDGATSLGEVARQTRSANAGHSGKVYTNDDLPKAGGISVVGEKRAPVAAVKPTETSDKSEAQWRRALAQEKARVTQLENELAIAEENQRRVTHYYATTPNPRYQHFAEEVESLKQQVADAKQALADLQEEARKAGVTHADE